MTSRRQHPLWRVAVLVALDTVCIALAHRLAVLATLPRGAALSEYYSARSHYLLVFILVWWCTAADQRLFTSRRNDALLPQLFGASKALVLTLTLSVFLIAVFTPGRLERSFLVVFGAAAFILILLCRSGWRLSLWGLRVRGWNTQRVIIIGANEATRHVVKAMLAHEQYGYQIEGFLEDDLGRIALLDRYRIPYLGRIEALEELLVDRVIDAVYITLPLRVFYETIRRIAHLCEGVGVPVRFVADPFPVSTAKSFMWRLEDVPLLSLSSAPGGQSRFLVRRAVDWLAASLLLIVLSPLFPLIAVLIKLDSPGPVFELQERVRRDGRRFKLVRFRCYEPFDASRSDEPPLTRIGPHLQRYNLDSLPNLFNVWLGQMSLSGARPPMPVREIPAEPEKPSRQTTVPVSR